MLNDHSVNCKLLELIEQSVFKKIWPYAAQHLATIQGNRSLDNLKEIKNLAKHAYPLPIKYNSTNITYIIKFLLT